jgi:trimeric autotransporter adhesin
MNQLIQSKNFTTIIVSAVALVCFGLWPKAQAVSPPPDGGYAGNNTAEGTNALFSLTSGIDNTGLGFQALFHNTTGNFNTAEGFRALFSNTTGAQNTANGVNALISNTTGTFNTADGVNTLFHNTTGASNTAIGAQALFSNITGSNNTATGVQALLHNTTINGQSGHDNTANGFRTLSTNTIGSRNTASGATALFNNTAGTGNTASGAGALVSNTTGNVNTANGADTLQVNTTGSDNTADGAFALVTNVTGNFNTANGVNALFNNKTGNNNIALGFLAGANLTTGDNNIDIGAEGVADESDTIRIGTLQRKTFIAGIRGVTTANANAISVVVDSAGQLGTINSSRRFKKQIKPMDKTSEAILTLRPVTFHYKNDNTGTPQFGLIAEEVAEVNPDLVVRDDQGEIYTVRYDAVNAMLLNEFLKEHRKVEELEATVAQQQKGMEVLTDELKQQAMQIQKVSAQLAAASPSVADLK